MSPIDPRVLRRASRTLFRHGPDLDDEAQIPPPATGRSDHVTQAPVSWETTDGPR